MKSKNTKFILFLLLLVAIVTVLTIFVKNYLPHFVTPYWSLLILFFSIVNVIVYFLTMKVREKNDMNKFTNFYMGTTLVKLFVYIAVLLIYILLFPEDRKAFVITFLAYYLCFSFYETYILAKSK